MNNLPYILIIGNGNGEYLLELLHKFERGQKHLVKSQRLIGGGGLNYTLRLLNMGYPVLPILPLGQDELGKKIQQELRQESQKFFPDSVVTQYLNSPDFLSSRITSLLSTIIIDEEGRSIFTEQPQGSSEFLTHIRQIIEVNLFSIIPEIKGLVIGDIHADNYQLYPERAGKCTSYLLNYFDNKVFIYANLGKSQINLGYDYWQKLLPKISLLQLNIKELQILFESKPKSLINMLETLRDDQINAVITLDKFGSIGLYWREPTKIIFAKPLPVKQVRDTTGAGDAFGAGIVSQLYQKLDFTWSDFFRAIAQARVWAAYACTQLGGGANCPNPEQLQRFQEETIGENSLEMGMEIHTLDSLGTILELLDKIYQC